MARILAAGATTLAFVAAVYVVQSLGYLFPIPFLLLYALVVACGALLGSAAGTTAGVVAAGFILARNLAGLGPPNMIGSVLFTLLGGALYIGSGFWIGWLKNREADLRARLGQLLDRRTEQLTETETRFDHALRAVSDGVWDLDLDTQKIHLSERWTEMLGYRQDELGTGLGAILGLVDPADRERTQSLLADCAAGRRSNFEAQIRITHKSGRTITVLSRGIVLRDGDRPVRLIGTTTDITERVRVMETLEMTQEMLYEGIQALPVGFAFFDADDALVLFNNSYREHLSGHGGSLLRTGLPFEELIRAAAGDVWRSLGFDSADAYVAARIAATRRTRAPWLYEVRDGGWIRMTEFPTYSGGFISLVEDVSEERRSEMRVWRSQRLEVIGQLTGGIAHDFNNVLAVIQGCAELLRMSPTAERELVDQTLRAVHRGSDLTHRLLAYARRQPLAPSSIDCADLIDGMKEVLTRTLGERVQLEVAVGPDAWRAHADPSQVEDMLMNLALNARDAMPEGGRLTIACANETLGPGANTRFPEAMPGDYVRLSVADTGTGMTPEVLDKAIEPFFTTKPFGKGSGLGLSMVYGFVRQSGGHIAIDSAPDHGTTVDIYLPRDLASPGPVPRHGTAAVPMGHGESVLLIEDDPMLRDLVLRTLTALGYTPTAVEDAGSARDLLDRGERFDLVLTDVVLPGGISGPEFAATLDPLMPPGRVIFMSGYSQNETGSEEFDTARHALLQKPFRREQLAAALKAAMEADEPRMAGARGG